MLDMCECMWVLRCEDGTACIKVRVRSYGKALKKVKAKVKANIEKKSKSKSKSWRPAAFVGYV